MEKRKFLYYNLNNVDNNKLSIIYDYIQNNIDHNENHNGLLINLSKLDDIHINKLYDLYNLKENKINYDLYQFKDISKLKKKKINKKEYKDHTLNNIEKLILSYSSV